MKLVVGAMEDRVTVGSYQQEKWSQYVTEHSNALDLEPGLFTYEVPRQIAESLKRSAESSNRRKADPFRSAIKC